MSLDEDFTAGLNRTMAEDLGEPITLTWPAWAEPLGTFAIVDDGFVEDGGEHEISRNVLTVELAEADLPTPATTMQLKADLRVTIPGRSQVLRVYDRRPLGAGAVQLICEIQR